MTKQGNERFGIPPQDTAQVGSSIEALAQSLVCARLPPIKREYLSPGLARRQSGQYLSAFRNAQVSLWFVLTQTPWRSAAIL